MKLVHFLFYMKTLALVAWICVADQSRGLGDDQTGISEVTALAVLPEASSQGSDVTHIVKEQIVKDDVNKRLTAANNVTSLIKLVGSSVLDHRDLQANPEQCSIALTVKCGPTKTCASIGFPEMCCSKWGWCGTTQDYCGNCCQNGPCIASIPNPTRHPTTPPPKWYVACDGTCVADCLQEIGGPCAGPAKEWLTLFASKSKCCEVQSKWDASCTAPTALPTKSPTTSTPTTAKPVTVPPTSAKPITVTPTSAKPTAFPTKSPTTVTPTAKPITVMPTSAKPTTVTPTSTKPITMAPTSAKPTCTCVAPAAGLTFLPDGIGVSYTSTIPVNTYPGQSIAAGGDIQSVCLIMEHSYLGDLQIDLSCPTGGRVILRARGGGGTYLGCPLDDETFIAPGTGGQYCFTPTATTDLADGPTTNCGTPAAPSVVAGDYKPTQPLTGFIGCPMNGNWVIRVTDNLSWDNGYIFSWVLNFNATCSRCQTSATRKPTPKPSPKPTPRPTRDCRWWDFVCRREEKKKAEEDKAAAAAHAGIRRSPSGMAGDTRLRVQSGSRKLSNLAQFKSARDLRTGDSIQGLDGNMSHAACSVEAVEFVGNGTVYGNYSETLFVLNQSTSVLQPAGFIENKAENELYVVLTSCPVGLDESGIGFTPFDSFAFGNETLLWSDYVHIHQAIVGIVKVVGLFVFSPQTYTSMEEVGEYTSAFYTTLLTCTKDPKSCDAFEMASLELVEMSMTEESRMKVGSFFPNFGKLNMPGSIAASVTNGASVIYSWVPDWAGLNKGCVSAPLGSIETYTPKYDKQSACCSFHYSGDIATCMGTAVLPPSGWYPAWTLGINKCLADGNQPEYMSKNPTQYLFPDRQACCTKHYSWSLTTCLFESDSTQT